MKLSKMLKRENRKLPLISIVIPSLNKVAFIGKTLDSIFNQNYPNLEIIIQDGGSTDGTLEIIKKYSEKYPETLFWVSKKDDGQLDAVTSGLNKARGEIVTFLNADDIYESGALLTVGEVYVRNPKTLWIAGRGKIINGKGKEIAKFWKFCKDILLYINSYALLLATSNYLFQPSVFLSKTGYKNFGPFTGTKKFIFEYDLWLKLGRVFMPRVVFRNLSRFRISSNNLSSVMYKELLEHDLNVTSKYTKSWLVNVLHRLNNLARVFSVKLLKQ